MTENTHFQSKVLDRAEERLLSAYPSESVTKLKNSVRVVMEKGFVEQSIEQTNTITVRDDCFVIRCVTVFYAEPVGDTSDNKTKYNKTIEFEKRIDDISHNPIVFVDGVIYPAIVEQNHYDVLSDWELVEDHEDTMVSNIEKVGVLQG